MDTAPIQQDPTGLKSGDAILMSILTADFFGALAGSLVHLTMVWWVLSQGISGPVVSLLMLCIFLPLNIGVLLTGVAVERYGSKRLLIVSKMLATCGALTCFTLLATDRMTLPILAMIAIFTYGAMAPSIAADMARVPAITKLAGRRLESFHATNSIVLVVGQMAGLVGAGYLWDAIGPAAAVGLGTVFVVISTILTWIGFPRDRLRPQSPLSVKAQMIALSRSVMEKLDGPNINLSAIWVTAAIIATAQGCIEVAFPIAVAAAGLSATALSIALVLAVITGVAATLIAQMAYSRTRLTPALLFIALLLLAVLVLASTWTNITGFYIAVGATSAAASAAGTLTITALQEQMPVSLQAQAIGLWEFLVLSVGSITILLTGFTGSYSLYFITAIALISTLGALQANRFSRPQQD